MLYNGCIQYLTETAQQGNKALTSADQRIFVSHSHLDNNFGTRLAQDLRQILKDERAVFYDALGGLQGGETWWEKIIKELTARDVFLLVSVLG